MGLTKIEVGGNFNLTRNQIECVSVNTDIHINKLFSDWKYFTLTSSGREAIALLLDNWSPANKTVLLPEYICHTEIEPFKKRGYRVVFYKIQSDLSPVAEDLERLVCHNAESCLYIQSYFGKDTLKSVRGKLSGYKQAGISIIEDRTQCWLSDLPIADVDFYITSLRKWLEIPDGGMLSSQIYDVSGFRKSRQVSELATLFTKASLLKELFYNTMDESIKNVFRPLYYKMNDVFADTVSPHDIGDLSSRILAVADLEQIKVKRQRNYSCLFAGLSGMNFLSPVLGSMEECETPLYFPIYVNGGRGAFQRYMCENRIYCPIIWPCPEDVENDLTLDGRHIYNNILCVPCDQRYELEDMEEIIAIVKEYGI